MDAVDPELDFDRVPAAPPRPPKRRRGDGAGEINGADGIGEAARPAKKARKLMACTVCNATLAATEMYTHVHPGERPHACRIPGCSTRLATLASRAQHEKGHTREREPRGSHPCDTCTVVCSTAASLRYHRTAAHTTERLACTVKDCVFTCSGARRWRMREHMRAHDGWRWVCLTCLFAARTRDGAKAHVRVAHSGAAQVQLYPPDQRPAKQQTCVSVFEAEFAAHVAAAQAAAAQAAAAQAAQA